MIKISIIYKSADTAETINRAIDNSMGTTTTDQGASSAGLIIKENLKPIIQNVHTYTNPYVDKTINGTPPLSFHSIQGGIDWSIWGNVSDGNYVGELSDNLFDKNNTSTDDGYKDNYYINDSGEEISNTSYAISIYIPVEASTTYTLSFSESLSVFNPSIGLYDISKTFISGQRYNSEHDIEFTTTAATAYVRLSVQKTYASTFMLNVGDTALPYEPYGVNIPIKFNSDTYNTYISDYLRKSDSETPVYDVMMSDGTIIRAVNSDGTEKETPTTETYTSPVLTALWGYNTFDVDTTVTPANVTINYQDN